MKNGRPLLSICIPTYNRSKYLQALLYYLIPEIEKYNNEIEVIVSDNASTDDTYKVIDKYNDCEYLTYNRNERNLNFGGNIIKVIEMAKGEYCWIIGDDDMINSDKISYILDIIKANREVYCFFVNVYTKYIHDRDKIIYDYNSIYTPEVKECYCEDFNNKYLDKWEDLFCADIKCKDYSLLYTGIMSSIFKTEECRKNLSILNVDYEKEFYTIDNIYTHVKLLAYSMVGKPAYYIGEPCLLNSNSGQDWSERWPVYIIKCLGEILDLYESLGVETEKLRLCKRDYYKASAEQLIYMCINGDNVSHKYIDVKESIKKFSNSEDFLTNFVDTLNKKIKFINEYKAYYEYASKIFNMQLENNVQDKTVAIWGYGEIGKGLYKFCDHIKDKVVMVVDKNTNKHGLKINENLIVQDPSALIGSSVGVIIVASEKYIEDIVDEIRNNYKLKAKIITYNGVCVL